MRKSGFQYEAQIFEHRRTLIATKRKLGIRGDDEDLVNHKVPTSILRLFAWCMCC